MMLGFGRYVFLLFAFGGSRSHESGQDTAIIGTMVFSFILRVGKSLFLGLMTVTSLVDNVVIFAGPGPAAGTRSSGRGGGGGRGALQARPA